MKYIECTVRRDSRWCFLYHESRLLPTYQFTEVTSDSSVSYDVAHSEKKITFLSPSDLYPFTNYYRSVFCTQLKLITVTYWHF